MAAWDWLTVLPAEQQPQYRRRRWLLRLRSQLKRPRTLVGVLLLGYAAVIAILALRAGAVLALLAAMPLLLPPLLSALIYWLLWSEFHR
jgi:hypothetical protein